MDTYSNLKPTEGENLYVEYDDEFSCFAVFGDHSGFCYRQCSSEQEAEEYVKSRAK